MLRSALRHGPFAFPDSFWSPFGGAPEPESPSENQVVGSHEIALVHLSYRISGGWTDGRKVLSHSDPLSVVNCVKPLAFIRSLATGVLARRATG
jgi:hypothetical protein